MLCSFFASLSGVSSTVGGCRKSLYCYGLKIFVVRGILGKSRTENDKTSDRKVVPEEEEKIQKKQLPKEVAKRFFYYNIIHKLGSRWLSSQSQIKKIKKNF